MERRSSSSKMFAVVHKVIQYFKERESKRRDMMMQCLMLTWFSFLGGLDSDVILLFKS